MAPARRRATVPAPPKRSSRRRRLSHDARREQLIDIAMPLIAESGLAEFSLDEVAARADVTRNLLYHYFPRGRSDLRVAVAERAGHELTDGWITDESIPIDQRMAQNFMRFIEHASKPTDAWRIHRMDRASADPEILEIIARFEEVVITGVSLNNFGTATPPPIARLGITGYMVFSESVLDQGRENGLPQEQVLQLLAQTFAGMIQAVEESLG
jgi:AcrR family transcriptional regulator